MSHTPYPTHCTAQSTRKHGLLWQIFIQGPRLLLTSRISVKCAAMMTALCIPSLLCCSILTIPAMIFQSPQQHAYFHFAKVLNDDPTRWLALILAGVSALFSLAVPAALPAPNLERNA